MNNSNLSNKLKTIYESWFMKPNLVRFDFIYVYNYSHMELAYGVKDGNIEKIGHYISDSESNFIEVIGLEGDIAVFKLIKEDYFPKISVDNPYEELQILIERVKKRDIRRAYKTNYFTNL